MAVRLCMQMGQEWMTRTTSCAAWSRVIRACEQYSRSMSHLADPVRRRRLSGLSAIYDILLRDCTGQ